MLQTPNLIFNFIKLNWCLKYQFWSLKTPKFKHQKTCCLNMKIIKSKILGCFKHHFKPFYGSDPRYWFKHIKCHRICSTKMIAFPEMALLPSAQIFAPKWCDTVGQRVQWSTPKYKKWTPVEKNIFICLLQLYCLTNNSYCLKSEKI